MLRDEPIQNISDDRYGREEYVRNLALALRRFPGSGSLVVGIEGRWGSGKTSLKNMLVEQLADTSSSGEKVKVAEFEPWIFSGSGRLVSLLFRQVAMALSGRLDAMKHTAKEIVRRGAKVVEFVPDQFLPEPIKAIADALKNFGEALEPNQSDIENLSNRREVLKNKLYDAGTRIIVFIDDLDRLMDDEVTDMMRAVKAVGDLPYMTYVLLYDRETLTKSLDKSCQGRGGEYLEKIIQVPIGLPAIPREAVLNQLKEELKNVVGRGNADHLYTESIVIPSIPKITVYDSCVVPFIKNMRDVNRLINEFKLRYQVLKDDVDSRDLLGITCLEVFNSSLHDWIMAGKHYLCIPHYSNQQVSKDNLIRHMKNIPSHDEATESRDIRAIESLFPFVLCTYNHVYMAFQDPPDETDKSIYLEEHFNDYFRLSIGKELLDEKMYKQFLVDDYFDDEALNWQYWDVVRNHGFVNKTMIYLDSFNDAQCNRIVSHCLDIESKYSQDYQNCISYDLVVAMLNEAYNVARRDAVIQAVLDSKSPVSMFVAACLAFQIHNRLIEDRNNGVKGIERQIARVNQFLKSQLLFFPQENVEERKKILNLLCEKLKSKNFHGPAHLLDGVVPWIYVGAIPSVLKKDPESSKAFNAAKKIVRGSHLVVYLLDALTTEEGNEYTVDIDRLQQFIDLHSCRSAINKLKPDQILSDFYPVNVEKIAAFKQALNSDDPRLPVLHEQAELQVILWNNKIE